jgi:hypothetical protein
VLVFIVADDLPDLPFLVLVDPSGTFPETDLTIGGRPGGIQAQLGTNRGRLAQVTVEPIAGRTDGKPSDSQAAYPDKVPSTSHFNTFLFLIQFRKIGSAKVADYILYKHVSRYIDN